MIDGWISEQESSLTYKYILIGTYFKSTCFWLYRTSFVRNNFLWVKSVALSNMKIMQAFNTWEWLKVFTGAGWFWSKFWFYHFTDCLTWGKLYTVSSTIHRDNSTNLRWLWWLNGLIFLKYHILVSSCVC